MTDTTPAADLPDQLRTALTERFTALGNPFSEMRTEEKGPDGWPASHPVGPAGVAEVLRELLAAEQPAPAADRAAIARVRAVLETEAVTGRTALEYRGLITSALMAAEAQQPVPRHRCAHTDVVYGQCVRFLDDHDGECLHEDQPAPTVPEEPRCSAGLLPLHDGPLERCIERGPHTAHVTTSGRRWTDEELTQ